MKKLVFMNLAVDQVWDKDRHLSQIFSVKVPDAEYLVRSNEHLGIYLSDANDFVLGLPFPGDFLDYLKNFHSSWGQVIDISANPFDVQNFTSEVMSKISKTAISEFLCTGVSDLEQRLANYFSIDLQASCDLSRELNNKTTLVSLTEKKILSIPPTEIVSSEELLKTHFTGPKYLKHEFGSGGGANFKIASGSDPILRFLKRAPASSARWLIQDVISSTSEGTVFGFSDSDSAEVRKVYYDGHGLSYHHTQETNSEIVKSVIKSFFGVQDYLKEVGYSGAFGLDFLVSKNNEVLFVDLNVRWTKTHLLKVAALKMGIPWEQTDVRRYRTRTSSRLDFKILWDNFCDKLELNRLGRTSDGEHMVPFLVTGLHSPGSLKEFSFFVSQNPIFQKKVETQWTAF